MLWLEIVLFGSAALAGIIYVGGRLSTNSGKRASEFIQTAEQKYSSAIEQQLSLLAMNDEQPNVEQIIADTFVMLKPEIDGLLAYINSVNYSDVKISYQAHFFKNAAMLAESYFTWRHNNGKLMLTNGDDEKMYTLFKDAMKADIQQRLLSLKLGRL